MSLFLCIETEPLKLTKTERLCHDNICAYLFYVWNFTCKVISMLFAKSVLRAEATRFAPYLLEF